MLRPNEVLLDVLMRAGAYPVSDYRSKESHDEIASVWVIPLTKGLPILISLVGNGNHLDPLVRLLRSIGTAMKFYHGAVRPTEDVLLLEVSVRMSSVSSKVLDRQIVERSSQAWNVAVSSFHFVDWFTPDERFHGKVFDPDNLPALVDQDVPAINIPRVDEFRPRFVLDEEFMNEHSLPRKRQDEDDDGFDEADSLPGSDDDDDDDDDDDALLRDEP